LVLGQLADRNARISLRSQPKKTSVMPSSKPFVTSGGVLQKVAACRFFLRGMEEHGRCEQPPEEFGFLLSAFLSALKSIEYLTPQVNPSRRKQIEAAIEQLRVVRPELNFLLNAGDAEIHRKGVEVVLTIDCFAAEPAFVLPGTRLRGRLQGRFRLRFGSSARPVFRYRWRFQDSHDLSSVVEICRDSLNALALAVNQAFQ